MKFYSIHIEKEGKWTSDEDHLRLFTEYIRNSKHKEWPRRILLHGEKTREFFGKRENGKNRLLNEKIEEEMEKWTLEDKLKKHGISDSEAKEFGSFLEDMLHPDPIRRPTAEKLLKHSWMRESL